MTVTPGTLVIIKHAIVVTIFIVIALTPAWLARQTKKSKMDMGIVRISSWLFGWTGIGWLFALFWAIKK